MRKYKLTETKSTAIPCPLVSDTLVQSLFLTSAPTITTKSPPMNVFFGVAATFEFQVLYVVDCRVRGLEQKIFRGLERSVNFDIIPIACRE